MTKDDLKQAQLREYPDSQFISISEMFKLFRKLEVSCQGVTPWRWLAIALSYMEQGPIQFYACGKRDDGTYKWLGMRFGVKGEEYLSGAPINNFILSQENTHE